MLENDGYGFRRVHFRVPHTEYRQYDTVFRGYVEFVEIVAVTPHVVFLRSQQICGRYSGPRNFLAGEELYVLMKRPTRDRCIRGRNVSMVAVHSSGQLRVAIARWCRRCRFP